MGKVAVKKGDEKLRDQITVIAKKSGGEKRRKEKESTGTTTTKLKDGKSATKQQAKKSHSTFSGVKNQAKVIAVTKTDTTKKVQVETNSPAKDVQLKPADMAKQKKHKI